MLGTITPKLHPYLQYPDKMQQLAGLPNHVQGLQFVHQNGEEKGENGQEVRQAAQCPEELARVGGAHQSEEDDYRIKIRLTVLPLVYVQCMYSVLEQG